MYILGVRFQKSGWGQGSGNTYRGLLFLVCLGCGQLTGIQERSKTVIWYIPQQECGFLRPRVRLRSYSCTQIAFPVHTGYFTVGSSILAHATVVRNSCSIQYRHWTLPCIWGTSTGVLEVYQYSIPSTQYNVHYAEILMRLNFDITITKIWYLVSIPLWCAVLYQLYHLKSGTIKKWLWVTKKIEPLNGVIFVLRTWTLTKNALERVMNRANLFLVMRCIFIVPSSLDLDE
jgi:hypothetical protein